MKSFGWKRKSVNLGSNPEFNKGTSAQDEDTPCGSGDHQVSSDLNLFKLSFLGISS